MLKEINSIVLLKNGMFSHFSVGSDIVTNFFQFLNFGESRFPPKKFYNIDCWSSGYERRLMLSGRGFESRRHTLDGLDIFHI